MHKLMIIITQLPDLQAFEQGWPDFLALAERMPGLRRETTSWPGKILHGELSVKLIHELYFDSQTAMQQAMESPAGRAAGQMLQQLTGGRMILLFAHHLEDELDNILPYREVIAEDEQDAAGG
jgi:uncharacterized protein (TIGR02118 family)